MATEGGGARPAPRRGLSLAERAEVLALAERGASVRLMATRLGCSPRAIRRVLARFRDTRGAAARYLQAQALRLAERVVRDATVEQALDVLSRPGVEVLQPAVPRAGGPQVGVFLSVAVDSLAGVQVHAAAGEAPEPRALVAPAGPTAAQDPVAQARRRAARRPRPLPPPPEAPAPAPPPTRAPGADAPPAGLRWPEPAA
jgi:hypothetical protein